MTKPFSQGVHSAKLLAESHCIYEGTTNNGRARDYLSLSDVLPVRRTAVGWALLNSRVQELALLVRKIRSLGN